MRVSRAAAMTWNWYFPLLRSPPELKRNALIVLNTPQPSALQQLWEGAALRVCADAGADRIGERVPDFVIGDLDSADKDHIDALAKKGTKVVDLHHDQDTTDLEKAFAYVLSNSELEQIFLTSNFLTCRK